MTLQISSVTSWANNDPLTPTMLNSKLLNPIKTDLESISAGIATLGVNVRNYGAYGIGGDDTTAILAAYTAARALYPGGANLYFPAGDYGMTSVLTLTNAYGVRGDGKDISRILMTSVSTDGRTGIKWTSGNGSQVLNISARGLGIYSADTTYTKIGLDIEDATGGIFDDLYIYGAGSGTPGAPYFSGNSSIGIRTRGRDTCAFNNLQIYADRPIVISTNPNTARTDGEDADHFRFSNQYLVALGHPCIEAEAGIGMMECEFDGYQAWVGGLGGFKLNDTRVAPVVPSRGISFNNVRREQEQGSTAYCFDITAVAHIQQLRFERVLAAIGGHGIKIDGALHVSLNNVTTAIANGNQSLLVQGAIGGCIVDMVSCYWQGTSSLWTLTNYVPVDIRAWEVGTSVGPQSATYAVTRNDTASKVAMVQTASGSAVAPTFAFTSDASLGLYRSEASVMRQSYGALQTNGFRSNVTTVIGNYTATLNDQLVSVNSASTVTVTLPQASTVTGQIYDIKRMGTQTVAITATSGSSFDGSATLSILTQYAGMTLQSYGSGYLVK